MRSLYKLLTLSTLLFCFTACENGALCPEGKGRNVTEELSLSAVDAIDMQIAANVTIKQGDIQKITVTGQSNVIEQLNRSVSSGLWKIKFEDGCFRNYDLDITMTVKDLSAVAISGAGDVVIEDFDNQSSLDLLISGSGNIYVNKFNVPNQINSLISGSGDIKFGQAISAETTDVVISGSGNYNAYAVTAKNCDIVISGSGSCWVTVEDRLDVLISGSGNVHYKGRPDIYQNITGSGNIINENP